MEELSEVLEQYLALYTSDETGHNEAKSLQHILDTQKETSAAYQQAYEKLASIQEIPACLEHIWQWFWQLHSTRQSGMNGPLPLSYQEIKAWLELTGQAIYSSEIQIIRQLDNVYLNFSHKKAREKRNKSKKK